MFKHINMSKADKNNRYFINHEQLYEKVKDQSQWEFIDKLYKYNLDTRNNLRCNNLFQRKNLMKVKLFAFYEKGDYRYYLEYEISLIFLSGWRLEEDGSKIFFFGYAYHCCEKYDTVSNVMAIVKLAT